MLRASLAAFALALCLPVALAQKVETEKSKSTKERSLTMQQEEAARLARQRREEEAARRALYHQQQQDNLRRQRLYPQPVEVVPLAQPVQQPPASPGLGGAAPVTAPATTQAPSASAVVSCSAAPACPGAVCRSVASTYGGGNAASVGRRDIATLCQQANSAEACCAQQCASAASCTAR